MLFVKTKIYTKEIKSNVPVDYKMEKRCSPCSKESLIPLLVGLLHFEWSVERVPGGALVMPLR